jgi:hypothetical protein
MTKVRIQNDIKSNKDDYGTLANSSITQMYVLFPAHV